MKHVVIAAVLAACVGSSFSKEQSPACAALQSAKEASTAGKKFEQYRLVTNEGEQLITTPEQAIELWAPLCQRPQPAGGKLGVSSKAAAQKSG
ncbi:hypothetical protein [Aquabacterium sp.]|uniref:hypothetical protein n=1 Tax=Aquabacterium sp. TaxID=1872578 RepID=UPI003D6DA341